MASHGPLHAPVRSFKIWRDERLYLRLEIEAALDARSAAPQYLDGTPRFNTDKVELSAVSGAKATFSGVETLATSRNKVLRETAQVHDLRLTILDHESAAYTIEWLENFAVKYCWPHSMQTIEEDDVAFSLSLEDKGLTVHGPGSHFGLSHAAVRLTVAGHTFYVCGPLQVEETRTTRSGSIVYVGTLDDLTRKKIRNALSLAFGVYLVETGHTVYDKEWNVVSAAARSAYSLGWRAFDLLTMPLSPLTERNFKFDIGLSKLTRMVDRLFATYEELDLGNLTWAYWHARTATVHIAPAHFGAAIEALQRAYSEKHPDAIKLRIIPRANGRRLWKPGPSRPANRRDPIWSDR
jgi:hypothetical protein